MPQFVNKRLRKGETPVQPIYTQADAEQVAGYFHSVEYGQRFEPIPGVTADVLRRGAHPGFRRRAAARSGKTAAVCVSGSPETSADSSCRCCKIRCCRSPSTTVLMECTYGDMAHNDPEEAYDAVRQVVSRTIARGGKVIIPSFAVGRTQELVFDLNRMVAEGEIKPVPGLRGQPAGGQHHGRFPPASGVL